MALVLATVVKILWNLFMESRIRKRYEMFDKADN